MDEGDNVTGYLAGFVVPLELQARAVTRIERGVYRTIPYEVKHGDTSDDRFQAVIVLVHVLNLLMDSIPANVAGLIDNALQRFHAVHRKAGEYATRYAAGRFMREESLGSDVRCAVDVDEGLNG